MDEDLQFEIELENELRNAIDKEDAEWAKMVIAVYTYGCIELPSFVYLDWNDDSVIIEKKGGERFLRIDHSEVMEYVRRRFGILNT